MRSKYFLCIFIFCLTIIKLSYGEKIKLQNTKNYRIELFNAVTFAKYVNQFRLKSKVEPIVIYYPSRFMMPTNFSFRSASGLKSPSGAYIGIISTPDRLWIGALQNAQSGLYFKDYASIDITTKTWKNDFYVVEVVNIEQIKQIKEVDAPYSLNWKPEFEVIWDPLHKIRKGPEAAKFEDDLRAWWQEMIDEGKTNGIKYGIDKLNAWLAPPSEKPQTTTETPKPTEPLDVIRDLNNLSENLHALSGNMQ